MAVSPDGYLYVFQNTGLVPATRKPDGLLYAYQNTGVATGRVQPDGLLYEYQNTIDQVGDGLPNLIPVDSVYRARMGTPRET